jgi:hypothetical protein
MIPSKAFTNALVDHQKAPNASEKGYFDRYDYLTKTAWLTLNNGMSPEHQAQFGAGSGGEMEEKDGKPPKMAAYISSSRMIYTLSTQTHNIDQIQFEKKLPTTIGGTANMDGYREQDGIFTFVEAKCREPYDHKAEQLISVAYQNLYCWLRKKMPRIFSCIMENNKAGNMRVVFFCKGQVVAYFDFKQMICHLLGIATGVLKGTLEQKQTDFIYLLYDPTELALAPDKKEIVDQIYERTCYECNLVDHATLLRAIFAFLKAEKYGDALSDEEIDNIAYTFTFTLASQEFYPILLQ